MNWLDAIIITLVLYGIIRGFMRGFIFELISSISLMVGLWIALKSSDAFNNYLVQQHIISEKLSRIWAFILVFILILLLLYFVGKLMEQILKIAQLNAINRILGGLLGGIKLTLVVFILFHYLEKLNKSMLIIPAETQSKSLLYDPCLKTLNILKSIFF